MKTILVVDDEPNLRMLVSTTLACADYRIFEAGEARTAHRVATTERPDLILLDWMLPGTNGLEFATALRADAETRDIPIIMLTAKGQAHDRSRAVAVGLSAYLMKPFSPLELMERVRSVLGPSA